MKSIKIILVAFLLVTLMSCNQKESLQGYYIANQETLNFMSIDIPLSIIDIDQSTLSQDQKEAYESINKLNMLGYSLKDGNEVEFKAELEKVKTILKDDQYQELFRGGNNTDGKIIVKYIGTDTTIDELIVLGTMNDKGFAIVRVLGDNMEPAKILKLGEAIKDIDNAEGQVSEFMNFFK